MRVKELDSRLYLLPSPRIWGNSIEQGGRSLIGGVYLSADLALRVKSIFYPKFNFELAYWRILRSEDLPTERLLVML